jgi:hypothetical protein
MYYVWFVHFNYVPSEYEGSLMTISEGTQRYEPHNEVPLSLAVTALLNNLWEASSIYCKTSAILRFVLWRTDSLLGNDRETNNDTVAVARQRSARNDESTAESGVFYVVRSRAISRDWPSSVS